jgi:hypothetical protein
MANQSEAQARRQWAAVRHSWLTSLLWVLLAKSKLPGGQSEGQALVVRCGRWSKMHALSTRRFVASLHLVR